MYNCRTIFGDRSTLRDEGVERPNSRWEFRELQDVAEEMVLVEFTQGARFPLIKLRDEDSQ